MGKDYWFYERREGDPKIRPLTMRAVMNLDFVCFKETDLVLDAMHVMREKNLRLNSVIVEHGGNLVGLVTETDVLRNVLHGKKLTREERYHPTLVVMLALKHIMTTDIQTLPPDAKVEEGVSKLLEHKIRCPPIVDEQEGVVGIGTETDMMKLLKHVVES